MLLSESGVSLIDVVTRAIVDVDKGPDRMISDGRMIEFLV